MNKALLSSKNMCWCTPQDFFDKLNAEFGFVLDPAATDKTAKCSLYYTPETDGLSQSWDRGGAVFCNPPYGREIGKWVQKAFKEARGGYPIVLLIPARTDTAYFHDYIYGKAEIRFVRGRLRFTDDDGNAADPAPFPSMVVIKNAAFMAVSLEELQEIINEEGYTVEYQNGANQSGTKQSDAVKTHIAMTKNHAAIIKQLCDLVPPEKKKESRLQALRDE